MGKKKTLTGIISLSALLLVLVLFHAQDGTINLVLKTSSIKSSIQSLLKIAKEKYDIIQNKITDNSLKKVTQLSTGNPADHRFFQSLKKCSTGFQDRFNYTKNKISLESINYIVNNCINNTQQCKTDKLVGPLFVNRKDVSLDWIYNNEAKFVYKGGWWAPLGCKERQSTAIIIPFRNREQHLPILLRQLHPMFQRQNLHYRIFVIDQTDNSTFNRGKLMNVGYNISQSFFPYNCFVFHDVDLIPQDDRIDYGCKTSPTHLSVAVDKFNYRLLYDGLFGGVEMFTKDDYDKINGFSNSFWLWGGEDDNLFSRTQDNSMKVHRQSVQIARYSMIKHDGSKDISSPNERNTFLDKSKAYNKDDGLNTLQYGVTEIIEEHLYTHIKVNLQKERDNILF